MSKPILLLTFAIFILSSFGCKYEYDISDKFDKEFTAQVVLNSILTPDSVIKAKLFWSKKVSDQSDFKKVEKFTAHLYENNTLIYEEECIDGDLTTDIYPREGYKYSIVINVPEYGEVKAQTEIPVKAYVQIKEVKIIYTGSYGDYAHYTIENISLAQKTRSVILRALAKYGKEEKQINHFYLTNSFCDQYNTSQDYYDAALKGSAVAYDFCVRIPYKNISFVSPVNFSITFKPRLIGQSILIGEDEWGYPIYEEVISDCEEIFIIVETPSDEYDKYAKAVYLNGTEMGIFGNPISVISNIENGIGIFAGLNQNVYKFKVDVVQ